jgi:hypothetical protein
MRAHTITTKSRPRRSTRYRVLALALGVCALAFPAIGTASPVGGYSSANSITGGSSDSTQSVGGSAPVQGPLGAARRGGRTDHSSVNSITPPVSEQSSKSTAGHSSLNAITGPTTATPTVVYDSPAPSGEGFDWASAAAGAGAAMALIALGGAALLSVRGRIGTSHGQAAS